MKKICFLVVLLCCLFACASAEVNLTGVWGFAGGAEVHGDGFVLYEDGTGEWLEAISSEYVTSDKYARTGDTFTWKSVIEGENQYLAEQYPDGRTSKWKIETEDEQSWIHIPAGESGGYYYPVEYATIVDDPFDVIITLEKTTGSFPKNKKYEVYRGPGAVYGRSGNGKGVVSTNGAIECYGTWKGWLMIEYEINSNKSRIGWIKLEDLPAGKTYKALGLAKGITEYTCGVVTQNVSLTDDPFNSMNAVAQLPAGTSVHVLAKTWEYVLVEGYVGKQLHMGFVHRDAVDIQNGYAENVKHTIDVAQTYSEADIHAAMEAVEEAVRQWFSGTSVVEIKYIEAESADADDWWQPEEEHREGMQLFADLNGMSFTDFEIAAYGLAKNYGFNLYRDKDGGAWEVCNWGYE